MENTDYDSKRYIPIQKHWKCFVWIFVLLFSIMGILALIGLNYYLSNTKSIADSLYLLTLLTIATVTIIICLCLATLKLIALYSQQTTKEIEVLSDLYKEEENRMIIKRDEMAALRKALEETTIKLKQIEASHIQCEKNEESDYNTSFMLGKRNLYLKGFKALLSLIESIRTRTSK